MQSSTKVNGLSRLVAETKLLTGGISSWASRQRSIQRFFTGESRLLFYPSTSVFSKFSAERQQPLLCKCARAESCFSWEKPGKTRFPNLPPWLRKTKAAFMQPSRSATEASSPSFYEMRQISYHYDAFMSLFQARSSLTRESEVEQVLFGRVRQNGVTLE